MNVLSTCISAYHMCAPGPCGRSEEGGNQIPETGVTGDCESLCRGWELNLNPLQGQPVVLTTEPAFLSLIICV